MANWGGDAMFSGRANNSMLCLREGTGPRCHRVVAKTGVHRGANSGAQGLKERSKKRNAARVAKAHGSLKLQIPKKGGS